MHKTCKNTGFQWPVFSHIRTEFLILSLYGRVCISENLYSCIFYAVRCYINRLYFNCDMLYIVVCQLNCHYTDFFGAEVINFVRVLINLSATTYFPLLCVECISISLSSNHDFIDLLLNSLPLSTHSLLGLQLDSSKIFWKAIVIVILFLSFKGLTQAYLL